MILLVGDIERDEFGELRASLEAAGPVTVARTPKAALGLWEREDFPVEAIVLAQAYPGQFSPDDIDPLRRRAPLARVVVAAGSWCDGEPRSGQPLPAAARMAWHQARVRSARELSRLCAGRGSTWGLPVTASEEERLLAAAEDPLPRLAGPVAIYAPDFDRYAWLSAVLRGAGQATVWLRPGRPLRIDGAWAAVFDADECQPDELDDLRRLARSLPHAPVVVLMAFPRAEDRDRALGAGAASLLAKPVLLDDLFDAILRQQARNTKPEIRDKSETRTSQ